MKAELSVEFVLTTLSIFLFSIVLATAVIRLGLMRLRPKAPGNTKNRQPRLGFWLGFFETALAFVFVFHGEFGALAIIFAAKEFVRKKEIEDDPAYFLLGTLANLTIAVVLAVGAKAIHQNGGLGALLQ